MNDRPGHEPAQPQEPEEAPAPSGFSFPDVTDPSGSPSSPPAPTFSLPDDAPQAGGPYGQPAAPPPVSPQYGSPSQYGAPGQSAPQGPHYSAPSTPGPGTPPPVAYPNPGYEPFASPTSGGFAPPPGTSAGGYGQPADTSAGGGHGQPPGAGGVYGRPPTPASGGYGSQWGQEGAGPLGFGGHQPAASDGQPAGPKDQLALVAMIVGLASTFLALVGCCYLAPRFVAGLGGVAAVVVGILAQQRISKSAGRSSGMPQAVIGIASGAVAIFLALLIALVTYLN